DRPAPRTSSPGAVAMAAASRFAAAVIIMCRNRVKLSSPRRALTGHAALWRTNMIKRQGTANLLAGLSLGMLLAGVTLADEEQTSAVIAGMSTERLERLDEHFHRYVDDGLISGVVTYIVRHGEVVHEDAYGLADIE